MSVLAKLLQIQTELKAPKGQMNKFGGYKYRSCEDILEAVKPICAKHNAVITLTDKIVLIGERYYVEATATIYDTENGESMFSTACAREEETKKGMDGSQVTGASSSYARKYALNGLLDIDDTKDSDATNTHGKEPKPDTQADMPEEERIDADKKIEAVHIQHIKSQLKALGKDLDSFLSYMELDKLEDMTIEQFTNKAKPALEKKAAKK